MTIEILRLHCVVATANVQSDSDAATTPGVKQSMLSRRIMQLEERLGEKLFERTTGGAGSAENDKAFTNERAALSPTSTMSRQPPAQSAMANEDALQAVTAHRS